MKKINRFNNVFFYLELSYLKYAQESLYGNIVIFDLGRFFECGGQRDGEPVVVLYIVAARRAHSPLVKIEGQLSAWAGLRIRILRIVLLCCGSSRSC